MAHRSPAFLFVRAKYASLTEGYAPFTPTSIPTEAARVLLREAGVGVLGERVNDVSSLADTVTSLGAGRGGRAAELATVGKDPRRVRTPENWDRTFARELGVENLAVSRGAPAALFGTRPRYDGVMGELQLPTNDTPVNVTKQLGRAAVDFTPGNPLAVRAGKRVIPRALTGLAAGAGGTAIGALLGGALAGPPGAVVGSLGMGYGAALAGMTGVHNAASKAADDVVNRKIAPVATGEFMQNYNQAARASRRGLLARGLAPAALLASLPFLYAALPPAERQSLGSWIDPMHKEFDR